MGNEMKRNEMEEAVLESGNKLQTLVLANVTIDNSVLEYASIVWAPHTASGII